jgi:hypothetical protein
MRPFSGQLVSVGRLQVPAGLVSENPDQSAFFTCLPDTVDPRGSKGK